MMSFGKMSKFIDIFSEEISIDSEGFSHKTQKLLATVRAYKEDRHGSERWANRAAWSTASALFRFRKIPDIEITVDLIINCENANYKILSVEELKNMYIEILSEKTEPKGGA